VKPEHALARLWRASPSRKNAPGRALDVALTATLGCPDVGRRGAHRVSWRGWPVGDRTVRRHVVEDGRTDSDLAFRDGRLVVLHRAAGDPPSGAQVAHHANGPGVTAVVGTASGHPHKPDAEPHKPDASPGHAPPLELQRRLQQLGRRPARASVEGLLVELCAWRSCSARELAAWLNGRDPRELTRSYLRPMVAHGRLAHAVPQMPKHPDQRYTLPDTDAETDPRPHRAAKDTPTDE
jgi:hypothetical protein